MPQGQPTSFQVEEAGRPAPWLLPRCPGVKVPEPGCFHAMAVVGHGGYSDLSHWRWDVQAPPFHMVAWASSQHGSPLAVRCLTWQPTSKD